MYLLYTQCGVLSQIAVLNLGEILSVDQGKLQVNTYGILITHPS